MSLALTFLLSLVGNAAVCRRIVRTSRHRRSTTNLSLLNLAAADLLVTIFCIPPVTITIYLADNEWYFTLPGCKIVTFFQNVGMVASICNLLVTSGEKFLGVCAPFYFRYRRKRVRYLLLLSWLIAVVDSSVYLKYKTLLEGPDGRTFCIESWPSAEVRRNHVIAHGVVGYFLPLMLMVVLHGVTTVKLLRVHAARKFCNKGGLNNLRRKKKAIVLLILLATSFAVCMTPANVLTMWAYLGSGTPDIEFLHRIYAVSICLYFFNTACHPLIYVLIGYVRF